MDLLPFGAVTELSRWLFPQYSWCLCCRHGKLNILPSLSSSPDRKTSRTALLFLRSFISTAFLALFLFSMCVCVC